MDLLSRPQKWVLQLKVSLWWMCKNDIVRGKGSEGRGNSIIWTHDLSHVALQGPLHTHMLKWLRLWWKSPTVCMHWNEKLIHFKVSQTCSHNKIGIQITCDLRNYDYCHGCSKIDAAICMMRDSKIHLPILEWWCDHYPQQFLCQIIY